MKQLPGSCHSSLMRAFHCVALTVLAFSCKGSASPNSSNAAPPLEDRDEIGQYRPYYITGGMNEPRYLHQAIRLKSGLIFVAGGTDERGFSSFATAELFDETSLRKGEVRPPSQTGVWLDTDFEGNPISMEFSRFWHTMSVLPDNRVLVLGGGANWLRARPIEKVEIFNPETRTFETLEDTNMLLPRVRFTTNTLSDGNILISGGQVHELFVEIQQQQVTGGGFSGGQVTVQFQTDIFPSTDSVELFSFRDLEFSELTLPESTRISTLSSSRGRAGHVSVPFAGFDNKLRTGDDLLFLVGGFQTPSSGQLVQQIMVPRQAPSAIAMKNIEIYDHTQRIFSQIGTVLLRSLRVNDPQAANLGLFNERTPDGVAGLGNVILVTHGDTNVPCFFSAPQDELFTATFTGLGPAQGLVLNRISYTDLANDGHSQGMEAATNLGQGEVGGALPGRTGTNIVPLPRNIEGKPGEVKVATWIYAGSGAHVFCTPTGPVDYYDGTVGAGALFDPFYRLIPAPEFDLTPRPNARDLTETRVENINPTGVMGTWLALDGKYPSTDRIGFGDTQFSATPGAWPHNQAIRIYGQLIALAGEDGIFDTVDDRVLHSGGGQNVLDFGGEASEPSAELMLIPRSPP